MLQAEDRARRTLRSECRWVKLELRDLEAVQYERALERQVEMDHEMLLGHVRG